MKTQIFITKWEDADGKIVSFERWIHKSYDLVEKKIRSLVSNPLYRFDKRSAVKISVYEADEHFVTGTIPFKVIAI